MLTKLVLKNFQCHKLLSIDLDPHVTVLVGESDKGKSSVLRALRWLCTNRPSGDAFIRHGAKAVRVRLLVDGHTLTRYKRPGRNVLYLDGSEFAALGKGGMPDEAAQLLNVDEVNFQQQHSPAFWFHDSPGQVSKNLNAIVNLDLIDSTLGNLASELRKARTVVEVTEQRLTDSRSQRNKLTWVQLAHSKLCSLEEQDNTIAELRSRTSRIDGILEEVSRLDLLRRNAAGAIRSGSRVIASGERLFAAKRKLDRLEELLSKWQAYTNEGARLQSDLTRMTEELREKMQGRCPLCNQEIPEEKRL